MSILGRVLGATAKIAAKRLIEWNGARRENIDVGREKFSSFPEMTTFDHNAFHDAVVCVLHNAGLTSSKLYNHSNDCDLEATLLLGDLRLISDDFVDEVLTEDEAIEAVTELVEEVFDNVVQYGPHGSEYRDAARGLVEMFPLRFVRNV